MYIVSFVRVFCFQAEDGIRDLVRSRGLGDVYKRQGLPLSRRLVRSPRLCHHDARHANQPPHPMPNPWTCLLYTSDAADERSSVDLGGRRIIKKKKNQNTVCGPSYNIQKTV